MLGNVLHIFVGGSVEVCERSLDTPHVSIAFCTNKTSVSRTSGQDGTQFLAVLSYLPRIMVVMSDRRCSSSSDISYTVNSLHQIGFISCYRKQQERYLNKNSDNENRENHSCTANLTSQRNKTRPITKLRRIAQFHIARHLIQVQMQKSKQQTPCLAGTARRSLP